MTRYWPLCFLLLLFAAPALLAALLLSNPYLLKSRSVQHGSLIQSGLKLDSSNEFFSPDQWNVFYLQPVDCNQTCQAQQQSLTKLHIALGAERFRIAIKKVASENLNFAAKDQEILIVDPQGRFVMQYSPPLNFSGILKDIRRLLKYSHANIRKT